MSTLNLERLLSPRAIALLGASSRSGSPGHALARNLIAQAFRGSLYFVNPHYQEVLDVPCHPMLSALPETPDLVLFSAPVALLERTLTECHACGIKVVMLMPPMLPGSIAIALARTLSIRLLGPYSAGLVRPHLGLNATFSENRISTGSLALITQSTSLGAAIMDWADAAGVGLSALLSSGDECDVSLADLIDVLAEDHRTRAIIIYLDRIRDTRAFLSAIGAAARIKPVVVMKPTHADAAFCDVDEHTGEVRSSGPAFDAALARAGVVRIRTFSNLFAAAKILAQKTRIKGRRLAIVSNGAAPALLACERVEAKGFTVPRLSDEVRNKLAPDSSRVANGYNPVILRETGSLADRYRDTVEALQGSNEFDAILVIHLPDSRTDPMDSAEAIIACLPSRVPLLTCWMGDRLISSSRQALVAAGLASFRTPEAAVDGVDFLIRHHTSQQLLLQLPNPASRRTRSDPQTARKLIRRQLERGRRVLPNAMTNRLLRHFGIDVDTGSPVDSVAGDPADSRRFVLSLHRDATFGPVISLAIHGDAAIQLPALVQLPPLNRFLIDDLLDQWPIGRYLGPIRGLPEIDRSGLGHVLRQVSEIACELPDVHALSVGQLLVTEGRACAREVRIVAEHSTGVGEYDHLAIHPYPWNWVRSFEPRQGNRITLRPIRPEDGESMQTLVRSMSAESRYFRFMHSLRELSPQLIAQFTRLDYDRQMAFVAEAPAGGIAGISSYVISSDHRSAEFALAVAEDSKRQGLGKALMRLLAEHARKHQVHQLEGMVLRENQGMRKLMESLGFSESGDPEDREVVVCRLDLRSRLAS